MEMANKNPFEKDGIEIHWCPGCGNFPILDSLKAALYELQLTPQDIVIISGIGQAGKTPHFLRGNFFNGLHGRTLPLAMAVKANNPKLNVFAIGGDGDMFSEGGNHLIHAIRRNINVTTIIHDNMVYGLTKGQASPTSRIGFETSVQVNGVTTNPFNPIAFALSQDCSFIAQAYAADKDQTKRILKQAITHQGFAMVNILQPCVIFNKFNTYSWYKEHSYYLSNDYDPTDRKKAFEISIECDSFPLGIIYKNDKRHTFEETLEVYRYGNTTPLVRRKRDFNKIAEKFFHP
ncbi:MAG: 2-oxoacid ferredoxin oxidoreductase [Candidatus Heimdallarchaeota archaeon]|nr:2-oxoacid ferredoxin oxidoreductase [Candidatus Heimdallarchaeota archaeon]